MWSVITQIYWIIEESALYLLFGFTLAGVLHVVLSRSSRLTDLLSTRGTKSVALAALIGIPLPLCSCSVLPAGLALRKQGASKGATASFLISVPETDIVSILLTYGLLGPVMAIFRPLAALVTALTTGYAINVAERRLERRAEEQAAEEPQEETSCCCECEEKPAPPPKHVVWRILHYGFVEFFDDIIGSLLFGFILGGVIMAFLPSLELGRFTGDSILPMLAMLVIGIPMYVCATASTPIAVGLIAGGLSPGAALVFLLAGPATNAAGLTVLLQHLGRLTTLIYVVCIAVISLLMGIWLDATIDASSLSLAALAPAVDESGIDPVKLITALAMILLTVISLRRTQLLKRTLERFAERTGVKLRPWAVKLAAVVLVLAAYAGQGFFTVQPGERAMETVFGRVTRHNLGPGLYYCWPYPIGRADIVPLNKIRRIEMGFREYNESIEGGNPLVDETALAGESWMLTGNEDIIDIRWVVQYQIMDSTDGAMLRDYLYGIGDKEELVRCTAEWAIRAAVGSRNIDTLLTTERAAVERAVKDELLQPALNSCQAGIRIVAVSLVDVHAPPDIHWDFRDVASAAEDKMTAINEAYEYGERVLLMAKGDAAKRVLAAEGDGIRAVQSASGEGAAFAARLAAYQENQRITRLRLYFELLDNVLPRLRKYINLSGAPLDLWLLEDSQSASLPFMPDNPQPPQLDRRYTQ